MDTDKLKTPLLILAAPRSGSTALGQYLLNYFPTASYIPEPDWILHKSNVMKSFIDNIKDHNHNFIVKILFYRFKWFYDKDTKDFLLSSTTSKIRLRRRDVVSQMASLYIAMYRNWIYHYLDKNNLNQHDPIEIKDDQNMDWVIHEILNANKLLDNCDIKFDLDLYYEDLPSLDGTGFNKTPLPENYVDIKEFFTKKLKKI